MRSSRGLRITSLIVVSPVLLILVSLLIILAIAIQTQIKAWYNTILVSLPQLQQPTTSSDAPAAFLSLSRFASTAFVVSQNANSSPWTAPGLSSAFDHVNNKPSFDVKTTVASKRAWSPLRRIFPTTLTAWLGFLTVIAVVTWRKVRYSAGNCKRDGKTIRHVKCRLPGLPINVDEREKRKNN